MAKEYDTASEADSSDTLPSQRIYTPTSSTTGGMTASDDQEADHIPENVPLLYDQPPTYADAACGDEDEKVPMADISAKEVEAGNQPAVTEPERPCRRGRCRRGRCMRMCLLIFIKTTLLVGSLGFLMSLFGGFGPHHFLSRYRPCHWRWHPPITGISKSNPREITVDHGHRSIWGKYPLFDQLSLSTTSGSIGVTVLPQPADPEHPDEPARLRIRSESGNIAVAFSAPEAARLSEYEMTDMETEAHLGHDKDTDQDNRLNRRGRKQKQKQKQKHKCKCKCKCKGDGKCKTKCKGKQGCDKNNNNHHHNNPSNQTILARPYIIDIESYSGSIFGRFTFSRSINLSSSTGSITATVIPVIYTDATESHPQTVTVHTHTQDGSQQIRLTEPIIIGKSHDGSGSGSESGSGSGSEDDRNSYPLTSLSYPNPRALASHESQSGSMHVSYPRQWAGNVRAESEGGIFLGGKGLVVKREDEGVVDGRREDDNESGTNWWGGDMDVSLESSQGAVSFFAG